MEGRGVAMVLRGLLMLGLIGEDSAFLSSPRSSLQGVGGSRPFAQSLCTSRLKRTLRVALSAMPNKELLSAVEDKNVNALVQILAQGAETDISDEWGTSILQLAVKQGNVEAVKALLEHRADPNLASLSDSETTPLHTAIIKGNAEIVRCLIQHGADLTRRDEFGMTPKELAIKRGGAEISRMVKEAEEQEASQAPPAPRVVQTRKMWQRDADHQGEKYVSQDEARRIREMASDWDSSELNREGEGGSLVELVVDSETGEQTLRRIPLKDGARKLYEEM